MHAPTERLPVAIRPKLSRPISNLDRRHAIHKGEDRRHAVHEGEDRNLQVSSTFCHNHKCMNSHNMTKSIPPPLPTEYSTVPVLQALTFQHENMYISSYRKGFVPTENRQNAQPSTTHALDLKTNYKFNQTAWMGIFFEADN